MDIKKKELYFKNIHAFVGQVCSFFKTKLFGIKVFFIDHYHLVFHNAAQNYLRIMDNKQPKENIGSCCNLEFLSYTHLKKYQKRVRILTGSFFSTSVSVLVFMIIAQVFFLSNKSLGATYYWSQTAWKSSPLGAQAIHPDDKEETFIDYTSKDANLLVQNPDTADSSLTLSTVAGSVTQTDESTTNVGFNLAGKNFGDNTVLDGVGESAKVMLTPQGPISIAQISAGGEFTCAVTEIGTVYCWGRNNYGQLGNNNTSVDSLTPVQVLKGNDTAAADIDSTNTFLSNIKTISVGQKHICAVSIGGNVYCWGYNNAGYMLGGSIATNSAVPLRVLKGMALAPDVDATDTYLSNINNVAAGSVTTCVVSNAGNPYCWGSDGDGQLGDDSVLASKNYPVKVAAGAASSGDFSGGYMSNVRSMSTGGLDTGSTTTCAVTNNNNIYCWGSNLFNAVGDGTAISRRIPVRVLLGAAVAGDYDATNSYLANIKNVSVGKFFACASSNAGNAYCWGYNNSGQLGNGSTSTSSTPVRVVYGAGFLADVAAVSLLRDAGATCALNNSGDLYCWGIISNIGTGSSGSTAVTSPVFVSNSVANISMGYGHSCLVSSSKYSYCWGANSFGMLGDNTTLVKTVPTQVHGVANVSFLSLAAITTYNSPGNFTSGIIDTGHPNAGWGVLSWNETLNGLPADSIKFRVRSCNDISCTGEDSSKDFTANCTDIFNGAVLSTGGCVSVGDQFIQYQVVLTNNDPLKTPFLNDVTLNYSYYPANQTLISSVYNTGSNENVMKGLLLKGGLGASGTEIDAQLRTSSDGVSWTNWCGSTVCDNVDTFSFTSPTSNPGQNIDLPAGHSIITTTNDDQYFQYKLVLNSDGAYAPTVESVGASYIINAPPEIQNVTALENVDGTVSLEYEVRDPDTITGSVNSVLQYCDGTCTSTTDSDWKTAAAVVYKDVDDAVKTNQDTVETVNWKTYRMTWNAKQEYSGNFNANFKIQIKSDDSEQANRYGYGSSGNFLLDTKNPAGASFTIDRTQGKLFLATPTDDSAYVVAFSNTPDFSDATFEVFQDTVLYSNFTDDPATVYLRVRDVYGNYSDVSTTTPAKPQNVVYYDVSNSGANDYREFIAWNVVSALQSGSGFAEYKIFRSTDGVNFTEIVDPGNPIQDRNTNYFIDTNLVPATHYYYKIETIDTNGNVSQFSTVVDDIPDGQGGTDQTPPTISQVQVSSISTTSATVQWKTDELSDSSVGYSTDTAYLPERGISSMVLDHSVTLTGLNPGATYNIQIKSRDNASNLSTNNKDNPGNSQVANFVFSTLSGPSISNVTIPEVSNMQAKISWQTNTNSSTYVIYSDEISNGSLLNPIEIGTPDLVGGAGPYTHLQIVGSLTTGTGYYFEVKSVDAFGNIAIDNNGGAYYSLTTTMDNDAPVINADSDNPLMLTDTQVSVGCATSEKAASRIGYKKNTDGSFSYTDWGVGYNMDHLFVLSGLEKNTNYDYVFETKDINNNLSSSESYQFTTKESQVEHPDLIDPGNIDSSNVLIFSDTQAVVSINTNTSSTAKLCYSASSISDVNFVTCLEENSSDNLHLINDANPSTSHIFSLGSGLSDSDNPAMNPNTQYYFRIRVTDSENNALSFLTDSASVITKKVQIDQQDSLLSISTPSASDISVSTNFAFISWTTDQLANSFVGCSTISNDDNFPQIFNQNLTDYQTSHTLKLLNLTANTKYYCKVISADNLSPSTSKTSDEFSFTTQKDASMDHDPLKNIVFNAKNPSVLTDTDAVISFETDQIAVCYVEYKEQNILEWTLALKYSESADNYNINHNIHISNLLPDTTYLYRVSCLDNLPEAEAVVYETEDGENDGNVLKFTTKEKMMTNTEWGSENSSDKTLPIISNVKVVSVTGESATISWDTANEKSSSNVRYGIVDIFENVAGDGKVNNSSANYTSSHTVVIGGLIPATKYIYTVLSADALGNIAESSQSSFTTSSPSSLSSIKVESKNLGEATISWETNQKTTSIVEYGLSTSYGEKKESNSLVTEHSITLSSLNQGSVYHYRVKGKDKDGKFFASADNTFEPKSPAKITDVIVNGITEHGAVVSFKTNVPTDAQIIYTDVRDRNITGAQGSMDLSTDHKIELVNLAQGTTFNMTIAVKDEQGTESRISAADFTTGKDENPPKIENIKTDSALTQSDKVQSIISWKTDEQATTSVLYKEGSSGEEREIKISNGLTTNHVSVITIFKAGTVYNFRVKSVDLSGNVAISNNFALLTPRKRENIIQIIVGNFSDIFGWAKF